MTTVNQISIDEKGDYLASCSNDGKVSLLFLILNSFLSFENLYAHS